MTATLYICPSCESGAVSPPALTGGDYACSVCGWKGQDPFLVPLKNSPFASGEAAASQFCRELLTSFSKVAALPIGQILVSWGLVAVDPQGKPRVKELARYLKAMAIGMTSAVVDEQLTIEKERVEARYGAHAGQG